MKILKKIIKKTLKLDDKLSDFQKAYLYNNALSNYDYAIKFREIMKIFEAMAKDFSHSGLSREKLRGMLNARINQTIKIFPDMDGAINFSLSTAPRIFKMLDKEAFKKALIYKEVKTDKQKFENGEALINAMKEFCEKELKKMQPKKPEMKVVKNK